MSILHGSLIPRDVVYAFSRHLKICRIESDIDSDEDLIIYYNDRHLFIGPVSLHDGVSKTKFLCLDAPIELPAIKEYFPELSFDIVVETVGLPVFKIIGARIVD